jgi:hypothetical protein
MIYAEDPQLLDRIDELSKSIFVNRPDLIEQVEISIPRIETRSTIRTFWRNPIVSTVIIEDKHVVFSGVPSVPQPRFVSSDANHRCFKSMSSFTAFKPPILAAN